MDDFPQVDEQAAARCLTLYGQNRPTGVRMSAAPVRSIFELLSDYTESELFDVIQRAVKRGACNFAYIGATLSNVHGARDSTAKAGSRPPPWDGLDGIDCEDAFIARYGDVARQEVARWKSA